MIEHDFLWSEKYRPRTVAECILPKDLKATFQSFVDNKLVPNLMLTGRAGIGKTSVAKAMLEELGCDYIVINGSLNGNIDTLRNDIASFASSISLSGGRKYVILDEADYINANSTQPALRSFMEEFSSNCGFILTCNFKNRIIEPLHSRCSVIEFAVPTEEKPELAMFFFKRVITILEKENIKYDKKTVVQLVQKHFPDFRRVLNELQRFSAATGSVDNSMLFSMSDESFGALVGFLKAKDFTNVRKWIAENSDADQASFFRKLYDTSSVLMDGNSVPQLVLLLGDYQHKAAFALDTEINMAALCVEIMSSCTFK